MGEVFLSLLLLAHRIGLVLVGVYSGVKKYHQRLVRRVISSWRQAYHRSRVILAKKIRLVKKKSKAVRLFWRRWQVKANKKTSLLVKNLVKRVRSRVALTGILGLGIGLLAVLMFQVTVIHNWPARWNSIPNPRTIQDFALPAATLIYDQKGTLLYSSYADTNRVPVSLQSIPAFMIDATIASEDKRFYQHHGIDPIAAVRASFRNLKSDHKQGGSTLTQQVARSVFLHRNKTISRKLTEALIAIRMERNLSKDQILELYFNTVSYGGNVIGVEAAAWRYFGKPASQLTEKEIIFLVSITPAPAVYSRDDRADSPHIQYVLNQLRDSQKISSDQYAHLLSAPLNFKPQITYKRAPHAVDYILNQLNLMYDQETIDQGLIVKSSIDLETHNSFQQIVAEEVALHGKDFNFSNAAALVVDPKDGRVISMVGSADYFNPEFGQVNLTTSKRQLGSTMKIIPYSYALENGFNSESIIADVPTKFKDYNDYTPSNYDKNFHGNITLKQAFANSYNIPALKVTHELGVDNVAEFGTTMGVTEFSDLDSKPPLSLAIGGVETTLLHLTQAYQTIANDGSKLPISLIDQISDYQNHTLYARTDQPVQVVAPQTASTIFDILSDAGARQSAFGRPAYFNFSRDKVALKSGTSNDLRDNVTFSFTPSFVVATWVGNNDATSMRHVASGYSGASVIMHKITNQLLQNRNYVSTQNMQVIAERR